MREAEALEALAALSQETRLRLFRLLLRVGDHGMPAGEIGDALGVSSSNLSFHLARLEAAGLIVSRRDARSILYVAARGHVARLVEFLVDDWSDAPGEATPLPVVAPAAGAGEPLRVLLLCSGNSARSIMAEAILRRDGAGRFEAFSAGSAPRAAVDPLALEILAEHGYPTQGLAPKDWRIFAGPDAPRVDIALTICDATLGEPCPHWQGDPVSAHWGVADPAAITRSVSARREAFERAFRVLRRRIEAFVALPFDRLDRFAAAEKLAEIGAMEGASLKAIAPAGRAFGRSRGSRGDGRR
ncbi:MAG: MarR family transcriptional regulator [Salinarimonadaceae bacterium]|nr:MAG: MarR family transcriptional regulator [Salinarimonadaceae bacterium]